MATIAPNFPTIKLIQAFDLNQIPNIRTVSPLFPPRNCITIRYSAKKSSEYYAYQNQVHSHDKNSLSTLFFINVLVIRLLAKSFYYPLYSTGLFTPLACNSLYKATAGTIQ